MRIVKTSQEMALAAKEAARPLGLVPTMGALHGGHLALVRQARRDNASLAVSIFINPAQFSPGEDLAQYPRDLDGDLEKLRREGADLVFVPSPQEVYPAGFDTWVDVGDLATRLEGAVRPGHLRGVATVVTKLLNVTSPDRAYFGQKDAQQTLVVRQLVRDLNLGVEVVVVPTVREPDGLAMSSRNAYLTRRQRSAAPVIYQALCRAGELWREGARDGERIRNEARRVLEGEPLIEHIDYVSVVGADTLQELDTVTGPAMVLVAVQIGNTRLIDNTILE